MQFNVPGVLQSSILDRRLPYSPVPPDSRPESVEVQRGALAPHAASILMKLLYAARIARFDFKECGRESSRQSLRAPRKWKWGGVLDHSTPPSGRTHDSTYEQSLMHRPRKKELRLVRRTPTRRNDAKSEERMVFIMEGHA